MSKTRGPVSNVVYVFCGDKVVKRFDSETATENAKNPMQQTKLYLNSILKDESHEYFTSLKNGEMSYVSGHPTKLEPKSSLTL